MTTLVRLIELCTDNRPLEEIIRSISFRNKALARHLPANVRQSPANPDNYCQVLTTETTIPLEYQAYHSGPANQNVLSCNRVIEFNGLRKISHVYFCLDLKEIVQDYLATSNRHMIYVTDVRDLKNARIQTSYSSSTLWDDKLRVIISSLDPEFMDTILRKKPLDARYIEPFKYQSQDALRQAITREITVWLDKYTIPFKSKHLDRYKRKRQRFILVPEPIQVIQ